MNHYAAWKNILIVFFLFILGLFALPNLYGSDLAIQISGSGNYDVSQRDLDKIKDTLSDSGVGFKSISLEDKNVLVRFNDSQTQLSSKAILKDSLTRNYVVALNLAPSIPQWLSGIGGKAMSLGLDLRGGVHFLLEVDMNAVTTMALDRYYNELRAELRKDKLYKKIRKEDNLLLVSFKSEELKNEAKKLFARKRYYSPVLVRGNESEGVKIWAYGKTAYETLLGYVLDPDYGDVTDPETGTDIVLNYHVPGTPGSFPKTTLKPRRRPSVLCDDAVADCAELLSSIPEIDTLFDKKNAEDVQALLDDYLSSDSSSESRSRETSKYSQKTSGIDEAFKNFMKNDD